MGLSLGEIRDERERCEKELKRCSLDLEKAKDGVTYWRRHVEALRVVECRLSFHPWKKEGQDAESSDQEPENQGTRGRG